MKHFWIFTVAFLMVGICSITAQDLIILRDGNIIEARVLEISQTDIRYKRFEHLEGPTIVIPTSNVRSIRYENGTSEIITVAVRRNNDTALNQDQFIFGINVNAGGAFALLYEGGGPSVNIELGAGNFNCEISLIYDWEFGFLATFNYFWHSSIGGGYLGGGIGIGTWTLPIGINAGYKFVTESGIYFRTGVFAGYNLGRGWRYWGQGHIYIKPDLSIGWTMR
jgi:hypothetical protein